MYVQACAKTQEAIERMENKMTTPTDIGKEEPNDYLTQKDFTVTLPKNKDLVAITS